MRAIWKGNISFALVSIPISLFSATRRNELSFHYLHKNDMSTVSYKRFCDTENVEVPWDDIRIHREASGRPEVRLRGALAAWRHGRRLPVPGVSLSHAAGYAAALAWLPAHPPGSPT